MKILLFPSQYLGARAPEPVKKKVLDMVYSWTVTLPDETKIADAYQMLKKQGKLLKKRINMTKEVLLILKELIFLNRFVPSVLFHTSRG